MQLQQVFFEKAFFSQHTIIAAFFFLLVGLIFNIHRNDNDNKNDPKQLHANFAFWRKYFGGEK